MTCPQLDPHRGGCASGWTSCRDCPVTTCEHNKTSDRYLPFVQEQRAQELEQWREPHGN